MARLKWVVEIEVEENWVADGFNLDNERITEVIGQELLPFAYEGEFEGRVIQAPDADAIKKLQGAG